MATNMLTILESISWGFVLFFQSWNLLIYFQQDEYSTNRFLFWYKRKFRIINIYFLPVILLYTLIVLFFSDSLVIYGMTSIGIAVYLLALIARALLKPKKIRLNYTARIFRLLLTIALVISGIIALSKYCFSSSLILLTAFHIVTFLAIPVIIGFCNFANLPIEKTIQLYYANSARAKIRSLRPFVIGITGSYGKTSTKEILFHILKEHKEVLETPKSFNTLMGVCKVINSSLTSSDNVFIVEMDAYAIGEIKQICDLVSPSIGIVTAVGPQHLERFGKMEDILDANYELISSLPPSGICVLNSKDASTPIYLSRTSIRTLLVGTQPEKDIFLFSTDEKMTSDGLKFTVVNNLTGEHQVVETQLIGEHNIINILMAFSVAYELGLSMNDIAERIKSIQAVEHRLQLKRLNSGVTIIDDAYNSNPVGASYALEALGLFEGRKILVTPGMVELGSVENDENYKLGVKAASICNVIILVGKSQTEYIKKGIVDSNFKEENILIVQDIHDAISYLNQNIYPNDTILYLNDLPDLYLEN